MELHCYSFARILSVSAFDSDNGDVCRVRAIDFIKVKVWKRGLGLCVRRFIDTDLIFVKADAAGEYASDPNGPWSYGQKAEYEDLRPGYVTGYDNSKIEK